MTANLRLMHLPSPLPHSLSQLTPQEYEVLREKGTERARTGEYDKYYPKDGYFACKACANPLYSAQSKFNRWEAEAKRGGGGGKGPLHVA